jgi:hypothetical protein
MSKMILDAAQSVFFGRELERIETKLYEVKYPGLEAEALLPGRTPVPAGVDKYTFRTFDKRGKAVPMAGHENGAPTVDVDGEEDSAPLMSWADAYQFNVEEIAAAAHAGVPLTDMRAMAARRALAEALNSMALKGYSPKNIKGLFNLSNTLTASVATGVGGFLWTQKTVDEILVDLFQMADSIANSTLDIESPKRLVLPKSSIRLLSTKRLSGSASDRTVLEFFQIQRPGLQVMGANYLDTAGAGSTKRAVVYDPANVSWLVSIPFEQMPVEQQGFKFTVNMRARGGGVVSPYPKSVLYVDGF